MFLKKKMHGLNVLWIKTSLMWLRKFYKHHDEKKVYQGFKEMY